METDAGELASGQQGHDPVPALVGDRDDVTGHPPDRGDQDDGEGDRGGREGQCLVGDGDR